MKPFTFKPFNKTNYEEALAQEAQLAFEAFRKEQLQKLLAKVKDSK